jgi:hypothetical protein
MKIPTWARGYSFYEEFDSAKSKKRGIGTGNAIAVNRSTCTLLTCYCKKEPHLVPHYECISGIYDHPNSEVTLTTIAADVLRKYYKLIGRRRAEHIHPQLIETMKADMR